MKRLLLILAFLFFWLGTGQAQTRFPKNFQHGNTVYTDGTHTITGIWTFSGGVTAVTANFSTGIDIGSTDTTLTRAAAGVLAVEGARVTTGPTKISIVRKTAETQVVNNSTTLVNDDTLLASLAANEVVYFQAVILHTGNTSADFKSTFTVPTGATIWFNYPNNFGFDSAANWANAGGATTSSGGGPTDSSGQTGQNTVTLVGVVVNGANTGNLQYQWAQNTAAAVNTYVRNNSFLLVFRE